MLDPGSESYHCFEWVVSDAESRKSDCAASQGVLSPAGCDNLLASRICRQPSKILRSATGSPKELLFWFGPKNSSVCNGEESAPPKPPVPGPGPTDPMPPPGTSDPPPVPTEKTFFGSYRSGCVEQARGFFEDAASKGFQSWNLEVFVTGGELTIELFADKDCTQKYFYMQDRVEFKKEGVKERPTAMEIVDRSKTGRWQLALHEPKFANAWNTMKICGHDDWAAFVLKDFNAKTLGDCPMSVGDAESNPQTSDYLEFTFKWRNLSTYSTSFDALNDTLNVSFLGRDVLLKAPLKAR